MFEAIEDFGGAYSQINIEVTYADGRPPRTMQAVTVCNSSGLLSALTTARPELGVAAGFNVFVNVVACNRLGIDPAQAMRDQGPRECVLYLGENPDGVTVQKIAVEPIQE
jgi:hypothetical protein